MTHKAFKAVPGIKVFTATDGEELEEAMNTWLRTIPHEVQLKRTQLSAIAIPGQPMKLFALVNYVTAVPMKDEA